MSVRVWQTCTIDATGWFERRQPPERAATFSSHGNQMISAGRMNFLLMIDAPTWDRAHRHWESPSPGLRGAPSLVSAPHCGSTAPSMGFPAFQLVPSVGKTGNSLTCCASHQAPSSNSRLATLFDSSIRLSACPFPIHFHARHCFVRVINTSTSLSLITPFPLPSSSSTTILPFLVTFVLSSYLARLCNTYFSSPLVVLSPQLGTLTGRIVLSDSPSGFNRPIPAFTLR